MSFNSLKKAASILTLIIFVATNSLYAGPESRPIFKSADKTNQTSANLRVPLVFDKDSKLDTDDRLIKIIDSESDTGFDNHKNPIFFAYRGTRGVLKDTSYQSSISPTQIKRIENVIETTKGLEPFAVVPGIGLIDIYNDLKSTNIFWEQARPKDTLITGESAIKGNPGAWQTAILLITLSLEKVSDLTLARTIVEEQIKLSAKQKALEQGIAWTDDLARIAHETAIAYIDKEAIPFWKIRDSIQERTVKLNYILNQEISLIPDLPDYPTLPRVKQPVVFNARKNISTDIMPIILNNRELSDVVFGLKPAALIKLDLTKKELFDLQYALLIFKHMRGPGIKILPLSDGRLYVYDEDDLRSKASENEVGVATTRTGLSLLITRDVVSKKGIYFKLAQQSASSNIQKIQAELAENIINKNGKAYFLNPLEIGALFIPTYERPDAVDRSLAAQTNNLTIFGLEYLPIIVADSSVNKAKDVGGKKINFVEENLKVINKYRAKGFNVQYISSEEIETWKQGVLDRLYDDYNTKLRVGSLDPNIQREIAKNGAVDKGKLREIVYASLNIGNIAGKRTVIQAMTQGMKIATADDDALPITRIPNINSLKEIFERRDAKVKQAKEILYRALTDIFSASLDRRYVNIKVNNDADFEILLAQKGSFPKDLLKNIDKAIFDAYAYSEDGSTGYISIAAEEIIKIMPPDDSSDIKRKDAGYERRLRFDRILHQGLPEFLVVSEDTGLDTYEKLPDLDNTEAYDWVPVDYLRVFDETLGATVGSPIAGRVFTRDLRGTAGSVAMSIDANRGKKILLATSHFSGDRDNSAKGILTEAMKKFYRDMLEGKPLDTKYLQQVVRKAIFVEVNSSVSTEMSVGNQFCFNTTSLDNTEFPIPTTGAWLRIEEPLQHTLIMFVMAGAMAWSRTVGGHERVPGSRRPKVEMQDLWEECAMVLYRELQNIFVDLDKDMQGEKDPAVRIRKLGEAYLARAIKYVVPDAEKENLKETCRRVSEQANTLYAWSEYAQGEDQQELRSIFGLLDDSPFGYIKQFSLAVYEFKVTEDGHTAICTKYEPVWEHNWEPAKLVESYKWIKSNAETVDLIEVNWDNNPVIRLKDGTELRPVSYKEIPRARPTKPGSSFMVTMADEKRQKDLITKAQEVIQKQFTWDGQQLLIWPDILKSTIGFDKFHEEWINKHPYTYAQFTYNLEKTVVLIPAAGTGSRLWPFSRKERPKQFCSFDNTGKTMIQNTVERAAKLIPYDRIFVSTTPQLEKLAREQLPQLPPENIIVMPLTNEARETSIGIGNAAVRMKKMLKGKGIPSATMVVLPSDQEIVNTDAFVQYLKEAISVAQQSEKKYITTLGIKPTNNATGYGYITTDEKPMPGYIGALAGLGFKEKPSYPVRPTSMDGLLEKHQEKYIPETIPNDWVAEELIAKGAVWNAGMFIVDIDNLLGAFEKYAPNIYKGLIDIYSALDTAQEFQIALDVFNSPTFVKAKSIDFEIMEKLGQESNYQLATVKADNIGWDDIGSWIAAVKSVEKDANDNIIAGEGSVNAINCKNCIFYSAKGEVIHADGLENLIIVSFPDASIAMEISREQDVKLIVQALQKRLDLVGFINTQLVKNPSKHTEIIDAQDTDAVTTYGVIGVVGVTELNIHKSRGIIVVSKKNNKESIGSALGFMEAIQNLRAGNNITIQSVMKNRLHKNGPKQGQAFSYETVRREFEDAEKLGLIRFTGNRVKNSETNGYEREFEILVSLTAAQLSTLDPNIKIMLNRGKIRDEDIGEIKAAISGKVSSNFLNESLQGLGISVDANGKLNYSTDARARGLDRDYEQAGMRTVSDLQKKEVIGKITQMPEEFSAIQETGLYNMIHGLVPTPRQKLGKIADGSLKGWGTLNFTSFNSDITEFPDGEIVKTTGHFNPQLDIQQVGQGEFISLQIRYDDKGNPIESRAQYLKPGDIFYALPGYFHVTIPVGEGPHFFFDIGYADGTYKEANYNWPNSTPAPYLFIKKEGKVTVVLNPDYKGKDITPVQWYAADKLPKTQGQVNLIDLYAKANEPGMSEIFDAIEAGRIEPDVQTTQPSQVVNKTNEYSLEAIAMVPAVKGGINGVTTIDSKKRLPDGKLPLMSVEQFNLVPAGYDTVYESLKALQAVSGRFKEITKDMDWKTVDSPVQVLKWMTQAINETPEGAGVFISIDVNADSLRASDGTYYLGSDARQFGTEQKDGFIRYQLLAEYYQLLATDFSRLIGIERAFARDHNEAWEGGRSMASLEEIGLDRDSRFASLSMTDLPGLTDRMVPQTPSHFYGSDFLRNYKTGVETRVARNTITRMIKDKSLATKGKAQAAAYDADSWRASLKYEPKQTGMGTSGFRGRVDDMRDAEPYAISAGFVKWLIKRNQYKGIVDEKGKLLEIMPGQEMALAGDFRDSSPDFMAAALKAYEVLGIKVRFLGNMSTPNFAYYCQTHKIAGIMITGSHTEGLYNGLKLYDIDGEVLNEVDLKDGDVESDRKEIMAQVNIERELLYNQIASDSIFDENGYFKKTVTIPDARGLMKTQEILEVNQAGRDRYVDRYLTDMFKGHKPFNGHAIIYWEQSTVVRAEHVAILEGLGAEVIRVGRRDDAFIALDTENMTNDHLSYLKEQVELVKKICHSKTLSDGRVEINVDKEAYEELRQSGFDVKENIIGKTLVLLGESSSDGDGDRSVVADEKGKFWRGDVTGAIVGETIGADYFVQSLTGNQDVPDYLERLGVKFVDSSVGSPYHVYLIRELLRLYPDANIIGQEVNGGTFIGSKITIPVSLPSGEEFTVEIDPLNTRDATTPMLLVFLRSVIDQAPVSALFEGRLDHYADNAGLIHEMPVMPGSERTGVLMHRQYTPQGRFALQIKQVIFDDSANKMAVTYRGAGAAPVEIAYADEDVGKKLLTLRNELEGFFTPAQGFSKITQMAYGNQIDDGFVMWDTNGDRFHVRRSGNAPETRIYVYTSTKERTLEQARARAKDIVKMAIEPGGILRKIESSIWSVKSIMDWLAKEPALSSNANLRPCL